MLSHDNKYNKIVGFDIGEREKINFFFRFLKRHCVLTKEDGLIGESHFMLGVLG